MGPEWLGQLINLWEMAMELVTKKFFFHVILSTYCISEKDGINESLKGQTGIFGSPMTSSLGHDDCSPPTSCF